MSSSVFTPSLVYITDITRSQNAVVTFSTSHSFVDGEIISFRVSKASGMWQINNLQAKVLSHSSGAVIVDLDTSSFDPFIEVSNIQYPALAVPSASGIIPGQYVATVTLEDAFDNAVTLIEWPEKAISFIPKNAKYIDIETLPEGRKVTIKR